MMEKWDSLDKKELIKNYLLEEGLKDEDRKLRFEIAWDIWENLDTIKFEIKQELMKELLKRLNSEEFKGYKIKNYGLIEGNEYGIFEIFKPDWKFEKKEILCYALEAGRKQILGLYIGIYKPYEEKGIPFKGNWQTTSDINKNLYEKAKEIYEKVGGSNAGWNVTEWWIAYRNLEEPYHGMWQREFYTKIITSSGRKEVLHYLLNQFVSLKRTTEKLVDEFVELFKREKSGSVHPTVEIVK